MTNEEPIELAEDTDVTDANPLAPTSTTETSSPAPTNEFTSRKTAAHAMMDAALFMANISQLRMILVGDSATMCFFTPLLCLVVFSILCQILFAIVILVIWYRETQLCTDSAPTLSNRHQDASPTSPSAHPGSDDKCYDSSEKETHSAHQPSRRNGAISYRARLIIPEATFLSTPETSLDMNDDSPVIRRDTVRGDNDVKFDAVIRRLHVVTLLLVFLITVANMFITGLGFDSAGGSSPDVWSRPTES
ncbi:hypothetical protein ACOMHN_060203 [Nucella lapillus]